MTSFGNSQLHLSYQFAMKRRILPRLQLLLPAALTMLGTAAQPIEVPSQADGNQVKIPLRLDGSDPIWAVFDTGAPGPGVLLTQPRLAEEQGWKVAGRAGIHGAGEGQRSFADIYQGIDVRLAEITFPDLRVIALPPEAAFSQETRGSGFEGVIGGALLDRYVVEIDYASNRFRLHDPEKFKAPQGSTSLPLSFGDAGHIFVEAQIRQQDGRLIPVRLVVDSGASHSLSLQTFNDERIQLPQQTLESYLGRGISGEIRGRIGRLPELHLGDQVLREVVVSFPEAGHTPNLGKRSGNLGMGVLRRFVVFFDYKRKRMILQPSSEFDKPFDFSTTGLQVRRKDDSYRVVGVIEASPASEAGIRKDDWLIAVEGRSAADLTFDQLIEILREENRQLRLAIRRGDEEREVLLKTRKLL